ncbi:MAG: flagellar basal body-associated FliL family protein [Deltaproteobacteria bacterium]|jgi:flagellar FliL protein|nr:flagellar basal body-associated FliL family protein [Deltaproteobacteria bacterium]
MANQPKPPKKPEEEAPAKAAPPKDKEPERDRAPGGKGGLVKILIIVAAAAVAGGGGAVAAMKFLGGGGPSSAGQAESAPAYGDPEPGAAEEGPPAVGADPEEPIVAPSKGGGQGAAPAAGSHGAAGGEGAAAAAADAGPVSVKLEPFTTNLNDTSGRRFLKVTIALEVENQAAADELEKVMPDITDSILILLSSQSPDDISTPDGKERLRSQILTRSNGFMKAHKIRKVKYQEFLMQ